MGFFGSSKPKPSNGRGHKGQRVCPQHGVYNSKICNKGCEARIREVHQPRLQNDTEPEVNDPSNGWW